MFRKDGAPAWVQAVGSVVALFIAVWIPWRQKIISNAEKKCAEKVLAQLSALEVIEQLGLINAGVSYLKMISNDFNGVAPESEVLGAVADSFECLEIPSNEAILNLSSLRSGVHIQLIQLAVKLRQSRSLLRSSVSFGNVGKPMQLLKSMDVIYDGILELEGVSSEKLNSFLDVECGMARV